MLNLMSQIEQAGDEYVVIDFSNTRFISPVFVLSLLIYTSTCGKDIQIKNMTEYMKTIHMNGGIKPDELRLSEFRAIMEG